MTDQRIHVLLAGAGELSLRDRQVLRHIARGHTNKEIAKRLSISVRTVERHRSWINNKLGLKNTFYPRPSASVILEAGAIILRPIHCNTRMKCTVYSISRPSRSSTTV